MSSLETLDLPQVSRVESLRDQVSAALRAALVGGRLRPGVVYSAPTLAEMFGVSATPVREAMLELVREGLVEVQRNRGFRVVELTDEQLDDMARARELLEPPTMADVAARAGEPGVRSALEALRPVALGMRDAAERGDLVEFLQADTHFHCTFLALAGNAEIVAIVRRLRNRSRLYGLETLHRLGLLEVTCREHDEMLDLAVAGSRGELEALVLRHVGRVRAEWAQATG